MKTTASRTGLWAHLVGPLILGLPALKVKQRNALLLGKGFDLGDKLARDLPQQGGRGNGVAAMHREETDQPGTVLQLGHVAVEVQAIDGFELERDMAFEQVTHIQRRTHAHKLPLVALRSKTSLYRYRSSQPWAGGRNPFGIDCRREPTCH